MAAGDARWTSTLGHVVESLGVPLPEVGPLTIKGAQVGPSYLPAAGDVVHVHAVPRPQPVPLEPGQHAPRFLLDVHLGTLARRLRLLGLDTTYYNTWTTHRWSPRRTANIASADPGSRSAVPPGALVRRLRTRQQLA